MDTKRIIFHVSHRLKDPTSGSQVHPLNMLREFEALGFDVTKFEGTKRFSVGRPRAILRTARKFRSPFRKLLRADLLFCFSETAHAPLNALERIIYRIVKIRRIPLLIYMRDAQWLVLNADGRATKRLLRKHRRDIRYFNRVPDVMFVPSAAIAEAVGLKDFVVLPPGAPATQRSGSYANRSVIYVGGGGRTYDLEFLQEAFRIVKEKLPTFEATVVTRPNEITEELTTQLKESNAAVVGAFGDALADLYAKASVSVMPLDPSGYANLSMPVKLFEYLAYGLPVVTRPLKEPAAFVTEHRCGIVASTKEGFADAIVSLLTDPALYERLQTNAITVAQQNTWRRRAETVAEAGLRERRRSR